jgi:glycosyltransferase involved in cell wall biosynthesis
LQGLVSIVIRTFNDEGSILKAIKSALSQSYNNLEVIIVNDGSTDKTHRIINSIYDDRLIIINQQNLGAISAAYSGIQSAKGKYITFLDADDQLYPDAIQCLCEPLKKNGYGFSYCDYIEVDLSNDVRKIVSLSNFYNIMACGVLFKSEIIKKVDFWDKKFILPEYDFIFRVKKKYEGFYISTPLYIYNRHSKSMTANKKMVDKAKKQIFEKYGFLEGFKEY